jgi:hypothetical protein
MAKTLKHVLLKQQKNIDEEIFHHLSRIKVLNDTPKEQFTDEAINKEYMMKEYHNGYKLPKV